MRLRPRLISGRQELKYKDAATGAVRTRPVVCYDSLNNHASRFASKPFYSLLSRSYFPFPSHVY